MSLRIEVTTGPLAGRILPVRGTSFSIGRGDDNDLVLEDGTVSRRHALVMVEGDGVAVKDLGSRNGIVVGGQPAREGRLKPGDDFMVGRIGLRLLGEEAPVPVAAAPAPVVAAGAAQDPGKPKDWRFLAFFAASLAVIALVLVAWHRSVRKPAVVVRDVNVKEGEERYVPVGPHGEPAFTDPSGIVLVLERYPSALSFRAVGQGEAEIAFPHPDGSATRLRILVRGRRPPEVALEIPPDAASDPLALQRYCEIKLGEAKALAGTGRYFDALRIARGVEGQYLNVLPKPPVAVAARDEARRWEALLDERLQALEEERRHLANRHDWEGVRRVLLQQKELVERDSAAYQRLKHLNDLNAPNLGGGKP